MSFVRYALVTVPAVLLFGMLSGAVSNSGYGNPWFDALVKPELMPPGAVFGIAWTILYILLGFSLAIVLHARGARGRGVALALFGVQMLLNYAWSPVFFAMHQTRTALVLIALMLILSVVTAVLFSKIRRTAALLMIPYIAWLAFAGYLNYGIIALNPEAETLVPAEGSADIRL